jgi:hypothetical protein
MKPVFLPALAITLALSAPAFAQSETGTNSSSQTPQATTGSQSQEDNAPTASKADNFLTIDKLKQDLQKAGFSDIRILADSFVVQAKDKDGNPTIMSLSPSGVVAIRAMQNDQERQAKAGSSSDSQTERRR